MNEHVSTADGEGTGDAPGSDSAGAGAWASTGSEDPAVLRSGTFLRQFLAERLAGPDADSDADPGHDSLPD